MSRPRPHPCPHCRALNSPEFDTCVRCGKKLGAAPGPEADEAPRVASEAPPAARARGPERPSFGTAKARRPLGRGLTGWLDGRALVATKVFLGLTLLVFGGQLIAGFSRGLPFNELLFGGGGVDALRFGALFATNDPLAALVEGVVVELPDESLWRCLSAVFVHYGLLHFLLNMVALVQLARLAEPAVGSARFAVAYVAAGVAGFLVSLAYMYLAHHPVLHTAGASGAVFGVVGLVLGLLWRRRDPRWKSWAIQAAFYLALSNVAVPQVNNAAHLGGLVVGGLFGVLYAPHAGRAPRTWVVGLAAACLLACVGTLVLAQLSPLWRVAEAQAG
ncbi:MAG: rhomboid family intramembrane serine protease [Myxococcales bacterium]|nr:rhomboid family intramembrane serine protease [Myxococcales bacterium]